MYQMRGALRSASLFSLVFRLAAAGREKCQCQDIHDWNDPEFLACNIWGDPHVTASWRNPAVYDFQGLGAYRYASSTECGGDFELQAFHCDYGGHGNAVPIAIAVKMNEGSVMYVTGPAIMNTDTTPLSQDPAGAVMEDPDRGVNIVSDDKCIRLNVNTKSLTQDTKMVNNVKLRVIAEAANKTGLCGAESLAGEFVPSDSPAFLFDLMNMHKGLCDYCVQNGGRIPPGCPISTGMATMSPECEFMQPLPKEELNMQDCAFSTPLFDEARQGGKNCLAYVEMSGASCSDYCGARQATCVATVPGTKYGNCDYDHVMATLEDIPDGVFCNSTDLKDVICVCEKPTNPAPGLSIEETCDAVDDLDIAGAADICRTTNPDFMGDAVYPPRSSGSTEDIMADTFLQGCIKDVCSAHPDDRVTMAKNAGLQDPAILPNGCCDATATRPPMAFGAGVAKTTTTTTTTTTTSTTTTTTTTTTATITTTTTTTTTTETTTTATTTPTTTTTAATTTSTKAAKATTTAEAATTSKASPNSTDAAVTTKAAASDAEAVTSTSSPKAETARSHESESERATRLARARAAASDAVRHHHEREARQRRLTRQSRAGAAHSTSFDRDAARATRRNRAHRSSDDIGETSRGRMGGLPGQARVGGADATRRERELERAERLDRTPRQSHRSGAMTSDFGDGGDGSTTTTAGTGSGYPYADGFPGYGGVKGALDMLDVAIGPLTTGLKHLHKAVDGSSRDQHDVEEKSGITGAMRLLDKAVTPIRLAWKRMHKATYGSARYGDADDSEGADESMTGAVPADAMEAVGADSADATKALGACDSTLLGICSLGDVESCSLKGARRVAEVYCRHAVCGASSLLQTDSEDVSWLQTQQSSESRELRTHVEMETSGSCRTEEQYCRMLCEHAFSWSDDEEEDCKEDCQSDFGKYEAVLAKFREGSGCCPT